MTATLSCPYNRAMIFIYLSPHFDDAALSCGGLIWDQVQAGKHVEVWNICAGQPPPGELSIYAQVHHKIWQITTDEVVSARKREDANAMAILGAGTRNYDVPDAIYRKHPKTGEPMYTSGEDLFGGLNPGDEAIIRLLSSSLVGELPEDCILVCPLTVGNHVDHQLVRIVAEMLPRRIWYYPEYPYTREYAMAIPALVPKDYQAYIRPISAQGLTAWQDSVAAYQSQISTFWNSLEEMRADIQKHAVQFGGVTLWYPIGKVDED